MKSINILFIGLFFFLCVHKSYACGSTTTLTYLVEDSYGIISCTGSDYQLNHTKIWCVNIGQNASVRLKYYIDTQPNYDRFAIYNSDPDFSNSGSVSDTSSPDIVYQNFGGFYRGTETTTLPNGCCIIIFQPTGGSGSQYPGIQIEYSIAPDANTTITNSSVVVTGNQSVMGNFGIGTDTPVVPLHIRESQPLGNVGDDFIPFSRYQGRTLSTQGNKTICTDDFLGNEIINSVSYPYYIKGVSVNGTNITPQSMSSWIKQIPERKSVSIGNEAQTLMEVKALSPLVATEPHGEVILGQNDPQQYYGYGPKLTFSGTYNSNSHPFFMARCNTQAPGAAYELRMSLGTDSVNNRRFVIGYTSYSDNVWHPGFTVTAAGNVGIGRMKPTERLEVNGTVRAKNVIIETVGDWSDFVFAPGYKLRSLSEVEMHIREQGHLPEIPSAAEVAEKGIGLSEINAKLLQKIEELTLYIIEQNKRLDKQNAKMSVMEKQISNLQQQNK